LQSAPRGRILKSGRFLVVLALLGLAARAWPQQGAPSSASPAGAAQTRNPSAAAPGAPLQGSIHGIVAGQNGAVYEGVRVALAAGPTAAPPRTQTTDSNGEFNFADVPPGAFRLTFSSSGFVTQTVSGILNPGESYDALTIVLPVAMATSEVRVTASRAEIAQQEVHEEEQQRVLGVIPNFFVTYDPDAAPLTAKQKYSLAWKTSIDPVTWLAVGAFAGAEQATNTFKGYGQGAQGYGKRFGAGYADAFTNTMIGGAILPALFKQDPRYFYKGTGTVRSRAFYAIASSVICKGDNGHWQANYSAILGGLASGGISNLYYPASDRDGVELTFENALIGTAEGAMENLFQEFVIRKLTPRLPHSGQGNP
jgi:hypothetical protein